LRKPELRDPRAFIIPANQRDFPTAVKFINALREVNVTVHRATAAFTANGKSYPAGSFVVFTNQAFRPHVMDMFEPQDHPNVIPYPGAPPTPPYDNAGWTLAFQMGVEFDRVLDGFTGPFEEVPDWNLKPPAGRVRDVGPTYSFPRAANNAVIAVNRLLAAGVEVSEGPSAKFAGATFNWGDGAFFYTRTTPQVLAKMVDLGVEFRGFRGFSADGRGFIADPPAMDRIRAPRIALWDQYGGSMESGWTRWILEQFEFPFTRVYPPDLDAGNLNAKYDVLILPTGAIPPVATGSAQGRGGRGAGGGPNPDEIPAEYRGQLGRVTAERTIPQLKAFVENGGTIVALSDSAMNLAQQFGLPVENHLVENGAPIPRSKFFVPGSVLTAEVDVTHPLAAGMTERTDFFFDNSPVFKLGPNAAAAGVRGFVRFDSPTPLHSGWAWGQKYLEGGVLAVEAKMGKGTVVLYGAEILERAQPHGTFKLLFNAIYQSAAGSSQ
jgi:hypothetical protein